MSQTALNYLFLTYYYNEWNFTFEIGWRLIHWKTYLTKWSQVHAWLLQFGDSLNRRLRQFKIQLTHPSSFRDILVCLCPKHNAFVHGYCCTCWLLLASVLICMQLTVKHLHIFENKTNFLYKLDKRWLLLQEGFLLLNMKPFLLYIQYGSTYHSSYLLWFAVVPTELIRNICDVKLEHIKYTKIFTKTKKPPK